jgi:hypothetical protein
MRCPHCQHENRDEARFGSACGSSLAARCPACGYEPPPGAAFCDHCGTPLPGTTTAVTPPSLAPRPQTPQAYTPTHLAEKILTSKTVLEGERKQVTVLFADLEGSTELIRDLNPDQARSILDPALHAVMEAIHHQDLPLRHRWLLLPRVAAGRREVQGHEGGMFTQHTLIRSLNETMQQIHASVIGSKKSQHTLQLILTITRWD